MMGEKEGEENANMQKQSYLPNFFKLAVLLHTFSHSLIHKGKTKEITTTMVVWIPDLN